MATIIIPTPLRKFTSNNATLLTNKSKVIEALKDVSLKFPGIKQHLFDENENIRSFINIFVDDEDIRALSNEQTSVTEESTIAIIPAIAGGKTNSLWKI